MPVLCVKSDFPLFVRPSGVHVNINEQRWLKSITPKKPRNMSGCRSLSFSRSALYILSVHLSYSLTALDSLPPSPRFISGPHIPRVPPLNISPPILTTCYFSHFERKHTLSAPLIHRVARANLQGPPPH